MASGLIAIANEDELAKLMKENQGCSRARGVVAKILFDWNLSAISAQSANLICFGWWPKVAKGEGNAK